MIGEPETSSVVTQWDQLPLLLGVDEMAQLFAVSEKTISRWQCNGNIPLPVVTAGKIRRWDREQVRRHLERRQQVR